MNPWDDKRLEKYRQQQIRELGFWVAGPIAAVLVLQAIITDRNLYPTVWTSTWLWLRLGILPVSILAAFLIRKVSPLKNRTELIILGVALYIAAIHAFFLTQTGYGNSKYFHSYAQMLLGLSIIPFQPAIYFLVLILVIAIPMTTVF